MTWHINKVLVLDKGWSLFGGKEQENDILKGI